MKDRRSVAERVADGLMRCVESLVSVVKLLSRSRGCDWVCGGGGRGRCGGELVVLGNGCVRVERFNFLAVEGWGWLERWAWVRGRGMPRPRNVLIPSLMIGLWLGYDVVYVAGADHSWMRTLEVDEGNRVVSVQPHFYADNEEEGRRVAEVYSGVRLHEVVYSFYLAFKGYHAIRRLADRMGIRVVNVTAGSFIDAFERGML